MRKQTAKRKARKQAKKQNRSNGKKVEKFGLTFFDCQLIKISLFLNGLYETPPTGIEIGGFRDGGFMGEDGMSFIKSYNRKTELKKLNKIFTGENLKDFICSFDEQRPYHWIVESDDDSHEYIFSDASTIYEKLKDCVMVCDKDFDPEMMITIIQAINAGIEIA